MDKLDTDATTCIAVGDPHFTTSNVIDAQALISKVNLLVDQLKPTFVVLLGDILHTHEKIHVTPLKLATEFITSLAKKVPVFVIIGNHDYCLGGDVPITLFDGQIVRARDVIVGDSLIGDDLTKTTVTRLIHGFGKMYSIKQYHVYTQTFKSEYIVSLNHTLTLILPQPFIVHKPQGLTLFYWVEQYKLHSNCQDQLTTEFMEKARGPKIVEITVKEFLTLPPNVQRELYGYSKELRSKIYPMSLYEELFDIEITESSETEYFGWELNGNKRFLLGDSTITHNCNNQQFLTDSHAFNAFKNITNVTVCDHPIVYEHAGNKFVYCPYVPPERFQEALRTLESEGKSWRDATCIFAHQEFYGCRFNPVATSTEGDIWPDDFPLVVSGHIHNEQRLQSNIYYTGSSMQHAFGENPNKTIALLTFKPGSKFKLQRIDLEMRKKKIVYINVEAADTFKPNPDVYTKLVIKGTPEQFKVFRRGQVYKDLQAMGLAISFSPIDKDREATRDETRAADKRGIMDILQDLIKDDNKYVKTAFEELNS